jgi:hypothetical protein
VVKPARAARIRSNSTDLAAAPSLAALNDQQFEQADSLSVNSRVGSTPSSRLGASQRSSSRLPTTGNAARPHSVSRKPFVIGGYRDNGSRRRRLVTGQPTVTVRPATLAELQTLDCDRTAFAEMIRSAVPDDWPVKHEMFSYAVEHLTQHPEDAAWLIYFFFGRTIETRSHTRYVRRPMTNFFGGPGLPAS